MATNLDVEKCKNILEGTFVAPSLNFMFVPSSRNKHAVAKCCGQLQKMLPPFLRLFPIAGKP